MKKINEKENPKQKIIRLKYYYKEDYFVKEKGYAKIR